MTEKRGCTKVRIQTSMNNFSTNKTTKHSQTPCSTPNTAPIDACERVLEILVLPSKCVRAYASLVSYSRHPPKGLS